MKKRIIILLLAVPVVLNTISVMGQTVSTFDTDADGWLVVGLYGGYPLPAYGGVTPGWSASAGNPGGGIGATDQYAETFFSAPAKFLGDQADAFGSTFLFDIFISYTDNAVYPAVVLKGATKGLYYNLLSSPVGVWTTRSIPLLGTGWRLNSWTGAAATDADMQEVLSSLEGLYINAEWKTGSDLTYLDNVVMESGPAPVCGDSSHPHPQGDLSGDCYVELTDFSLFAAQWYRADCDFIPGWCGGADMNKDGSVDLEDFASFSLGWLSCTDPNPSCGYMP